MPLPPAGRDPEPDGERRRGHRPSGGRGGATGAVALPDPTPLGLRGLAGGEGGGEAATRSGRSDGRDHPSVGANGPQSVWCRGALVCSTAEKRVSLTMLG